MFYRVKQKCIRGIVITKNQDHTLESEFLLFNELDEWSISFGSVMSAVVSSAASLNSETEKH